MKELLAAAVLIAIVVYLWLQPSAKPRPEVRESRKPETKTLATPVNNSTPNTDGSLASRWKTGPSGQTNLTTTIPDRWKTGPNAQTDLIVTPPERRKPGPK
jgi:hypothetical protein